MQNWEVAKKRISEMNKDEFIDFIRSADRRAIHRFADLCDTEMCCREKECFKSGIRCIDCIIDLLEKEYQPSKQEKWIVHRTLRTQNKEVYVGHRTNTDYDDVKCGYTMIYQKEFATRYEEKEAIKVRDELNEHRTGKRYLWVISKVEE